MDDCMPNTILLKIFGYFTIPELCRIIRKVCKRWYELSYDLYLWRYTDLSNMAELISSWEIFFLAFGKVIDKIEVLNLSNCYPLFELAGPLFKDDLPLTVKYMQISDCEKYDNCDEENLCFNKLHEIKFGHTDWGTNLPGNICKSLKRFPSLVALQDFTNLHTIEILNVMSLRNGKWKKVHYPIVDSTALGSDTNLFEAFVTFILENPQLLTVETNNFQYEEHHFKKLSNSSLMLEKFSIPDCESSLNGLKHFAPSLCNLRHLNISNSRVNDETFYEICKYSTKLRHVNIGKCPLLSEVSVTTLVCNAENLEELLLNDDSYGSDPNNITDAMLHEIGQWAKNLKRLDIPKCHYVSDKGVIAVAEGCPQLAYLDISDCLSITDAAILIVAEFCLNLQALKAINCTHLTAQSINLLVTSCKRLTTLVLETCHYLKNLNFGSCKSFSEGCNNDVVGLSHNSEKSCENAGPCYTSLLHKLMAQTGSHMRDLDLSFCSQLANDSIKQIGHFCLLLRTLNLMGCSKITDQGIAYICRNCKLLEDLDISGTMVLDSSKLTDQTLIELGNYSSNLKRLGIIQNRLITTQGLRNVVVGCVRLELLSFTVGTGSVTSSKVVEILSDRKCLVGCEQQSIFVSSQDLVQNECVREFKGTCRISFPKKV